MDIFAYSMLCFTSLFTLMDPLGVMPVFLQMTEGMSAGERRSIALKSGVYGIVAYPGHGI